MLPPTLFLTNLALARPCGPSQGLGGRRLSFARQVIYLATIATLGFGSVSSRTIAQTIPIPPPQDLLPRPNPPAFPTPTPGTLPPITLPSSPNPGQTLPPSKIPGTITVQRFQVVGNTVFSPEDLEKVTAPFTQRPLTFAELLQAAAAVTQLYVDQGYTTSGALIPPQTLEGGVVKIQVIEGSLEEIVIKGTQKLNPDYVRSRLELATQPPLNLRRLLESLQLLQTNPLIQSVSAELTAGPRPGTNRLDVQVTEAPTFNLQVQVDNNRSPSVGTLRRQATLSEANLVGLGDRFTFSYANTDGSHTFEGSYVLPINPSNGTLSFNASTSSSQIIEPPFAPLDIRANARTFTLTLRQPLYQTPSQEFALGLIASRQESDITLLGIPFPLSAGANDQGQTKISALRFFQEWTDRGPQSVFAVRSQFSLGLGVLDSTINSQGPDSRFLTWRGQAQYVRLLAPETLLILRGDVQLADRSLVPFEQFALGGQESVRGYRQDLLLTDSGLFASAELRWPILREPDLPGVLQLVPFADFGTGWNSSGQNPSTSSLAAIGVGLRWQVGDRLTARFDWGIPLIYVSSEKRTWQENGLHFSVIYSLF